MRGRTEAHNADVLSQAAHHVRQMLQEAIATAGADVEVSTENGKLVLSGAVPSRTAKDQLEQRAASAAPGVPIESRLTVRRDRQ
jgi:osmotically-inducible protein OsmY